MDSDQLRLFYEQERMREEVRAFMHNLLDELALRDVYKKNDVSGYPEARNTVDKLFARLDEMYSKEPKRTTINQAK